MKACAASKGSTLTLYFEGLKHQAMIVETEYSEGMVYIEVQSVDDPQFRTGSYFRPAEDVEWPRREDGFTRIWGHDDNLGLLVNIPVSQLCIGDIIPDEVDGWDSDFENDYSNGQIVKSVRYFQHPKVKHIWYWEVKTVRVKDNRYFRRLAPMGDPVISGRNSRQYEYNEAFRPKEERTGEVKPVSSGLYRNVFTEEKVTFKIANRKGRPKRNTRPEPESWDDWELIEGDAHPNDPAYN